MKFSLIVSLICFVSSTAFAETGPKYGPQASRLHDHHEYLQKNAAPDYWALSGYYVPQQNSRSCSVASVVMAVNAARSSQKLTAADELVLQAKLPEKIGSTDWSKAVGDGGHGVDLDTLGTYVEKSMTSYGLKNVVVKVIHSDGSKKTNDEILALLQTNEKSAKDFIIANFLQSEYTGDPEGKVGHIAPVAAYDVQNKRVLIMDPDRDYYEPYWVSSETFLKGLTTSDSSNKKNRGIVYVSFK